MTRHNWPVARGNLDQINRVRELSELKVPPGNHLERLKGDRAKGVKSPIDF